MKAPVEGTHEVSPLVAYLKLHEMPAILQKLYKNPSILIKIKRIDRVYYGNFATVARASSVLTILRDPQSEQSELLPDISLITEFELSSDLEHLKAGVTYSLF